jgi:hypothetical protein
MEFILKGYCGLEEDEKHDNEFGVGLEGECKLPSGYIRACGIQIGIVNDWDTHLA